MFSDKLFSIFSTFGKIELNRLRKFLESAYFNDQDDVLQLFEVCNAAVRKGEGHLEKLDQQKVWKKLWPQRPCDDAHLRRVASDLTQLCIRFRAMEQRAEDPMPEWLDQQKTLDRPGLEKHLAGVERVMSRTLEETPVRSAQYYMYYFQLHWNAFNRAYKTIAKSNYMEKLLPADHFLECFYAIQKLKLHVAWMSYRLFRSTDQVLELPDGFIERLDQAHFKAVPPIVIYRQVFELLSNLDQEDLFVQLLHDLDNFGLSLAPEDLRECYFIAQNYCALRINSGKFGQLDYYRQVFEIYRKMTEKNVLLEDGQLVDSVFKNIVTTGLRAGEYEWVENFIGEYYIYLPEVIRENARSYNLANLYSHIKRYDRALEVLRGVEYTDVTYALGARGILIRVYYEQGEYMALDSLIDSFRIFLRRNKVISKNLQKEYNTFLNLVKKLTTLSVANKTELAAFRQRVMATSYNTPKKWLLDKISALENR